MAASQENEEEFLSLFDFCWFEHQIFQKNETPVPKFQLDEDPDVDFSSVPNIQVRSMSDQLFLSSQQQRLITDSPKSVLMTPKLRTILSGKVVGEFGEEPVVKQGSTESEIKSTMKEKRRVVGRGRKVGKSRSLSELEFEELKGFMDLGFVFSEKDKDSSLVSILPGLQRLGKDGDEEGSRGGREGGDSAAVSAPPPAARPYLSEAWEVLEQQRKMEEKAAAVLPLLMDFRIPAAGNEVEIKHQIRFWAHSVASAVR